MKDKNSIVLGGLCFAASNSYEHNDSDSNVCIRVSQPSEEGEEKSEIESGISVSWAQKLSFWSKGLRHTRGSYAMPSILKVPLVSLEREASDWVGEVCPDGEGSFLFLCFSPTSGEVIMNVLDSENPSVVQAMSGVIVTLDAIKAFAELCDRALEDVEESIVGE